MPRPGYECRHNCGYWTGKPYLGFGLAASSYFRGKRFTNPADMEKYLSITDFSGIFEKETELTKKEEMEEYMFLGLRMTKGISKTEFSKRFGTGILDVYREPIKNSLEKAC